MFTEIMALRSMSSTSTRIACQFVSDDNKVSSYLQHPSSRYCDFQLWTTLAYSVRLQAHTLNFANIQIILMIQ